MKVFISVGMRGRSDEDIKNDIDRATKDILNRWSDAEIVDNFVEKPENATERLYYLGEAIKKLGECDVCYFVGDWWNYSGCAVEHEVCNQYGIMRFTM